MWGYMYNKFKKSDSLRHFDTYFMHNIRVVSIRRWHDSLSMYYIDNKSGHHLSETLPILCIKYVSNNGAGGLFGLIVNYTQLKLNSAQKLKLPHNTASKSCLARSGQIPLSLLYWRQTARSPSITCVLWCFRGLKVSLKLVLHDAERR